MSPATRESIRVALDLTGTPDHALARRLLARDTNPLADVCVLCAREWTACLCSQPETPRSKPDLERGRRERLVRAERIQGSDGDL